MKFNFTKKKWINIFIIILIILFSYLICHELYYLAYNYSKSTIKEGLTLQTIITQSTIDCSNVDLNSLCNTIVTDISNIQILDNNISTIGSSVNGLITTYNNNNTNQNSDQSSTIETLKLSPINKLPYFSCSTQNNDICININNNIKNINTINTNIQSIINTINQYPDGSGNMNSVTIQNITEQNSISPCPNSSNIVNSTICQIVNTNINNIYTLSSNIASLNNVVTNLQSDQKNQANQANNAGNNIASQVGISLQ